MKYKIEEGEEGLCTYLCIEDFSSLELEISFVDTEEKEHPSDSQIKALDYIIENSEEIVKVVTKYIYDEREVLEDVYWSTGIKKPDCFSLENASKHFTINEIKIHTKNKDEISYYGLIGECDWDPEHGFGVTMHGNIILELGDYSTGQYGWGINSRDSTLAEMYHLEPLSKRRLRLKELSQTVTYKNLKDYLDLFNWLVNLRSIYGYRSSPVDLSDLEIVALIQSLTYLDLRDKEIKELPNYFILLNSFKWLTLEYNNLRELPNWIGQFYQLESLNVSDNNLETIPTSIEQVSTLKKINLRNNNLSQNEIDRVKNIFNTIEITL